MKAYRIRPGSMIEGLEIFESQSAPLGPYDVRVRVRAVALNYRDLMVAKGSYPISKEHFVVPCSDGAGEVIAVGSSVENFKINDKVVGTFFPDWIEGDITPEKTKRSLGGGNADGMLREEFVAVENALVRVPNRLSFPEAATLPCAGVTAWNALFVAGALQPGATVLLLGTGGVSIIALQLAKAAGMRVIITSSDDAKLKRAQSLGADAVVNYKIHPEWQLEVLRLTNNIGVDLVLEIGGDQTSARSVASVRMGGKIAIIGGITGFNGGPNAASLLFGAKQALGIFIGSHLMTKNLAQFVGLQGIKPVVDEIFPFVQAKEAFYRLESGKHFGKVVIRLD